MQCRWRALALHNYAAAVLVHVHSVLYAGGATAAPAGGDGTTVAVHNVSAWSSTTSTPRVSLHYRRPGSPITRGYGITCCAGGAPTLHDDFEPYLLNFTAEEQPGAVPTYSGDVDGGKCARFVGNYVMQDEPEVYELGGRLGLMVRCACPDPLMDRNCRLLHACHNGGYRSFSNRLRCVCPGRYFGALCEHWCSRGERRKWDNGTDYCWCTGDYTGATCQQPVCLNAGTPLSNRCVCAAHYSGQHCERRLVYPRGTWRGDAGDPLQADGYGSGLVEGQGAGGRRGGDFTGATFSIGLLVILLVLMYCVLRRRLKSLSRRARLLNDMLAVQRRTADIVHGRQQLRLHRGAQRTASGGVEAPLPPPPSYDELAAMAGSEGGGSAAQLPSYDDALKHQVLQSNGGPLPLATVPHSDSAPGSQPPSDSGTDSPDSPAASGGASSSSSGDNADGGSDGTAVSRTTSV